MTLNEAQAVLDDITYPRASFRLAHMWDDALGVAVTVQVEDAYRTGEEMTPVRAVHLSGGENPEEALLRAAFDAVLAHERHEAGEFFMYQGKRPFDPHGEAE